MRYAVFDFETTGLTLPTVSDLAKQPKIIEIGAVVLVDGKIVEEYGQLVCPGEPVSAEITKITGITNDMLAGQPRFKDCVDRIASLCRGADFFVAHNAPFDRACLEYELLRLEEEAFPWPRETLCTVQEYVHEFGRRPKLTELYERKLGRLLAQTHRALDDVRALAEILIHEGVV